MPVYRISLKVVTIVVGLTFLLIRPTYALSIKDHCEKLENEAKGAFLAGYNDGKLKGLQARKYEQGNLKAVKTLHEHLTLADFIEEIFPSDPYAERARKRVEMLIKNQIDKHHDDGKGDIGVEAVIGGFIEQRYVNYSEDRIQ